MDFNDDDNEYEEFDFLGPDPDETPEEREEFERIQNMPIVEKANDIDTLLYAVCASMPENDDYSIHLQQDFKELGSNIEMDVVEAESTKEYSKKMEYAVSARHNVRLLLTSLSLCESRNYINQDYMTIILEAIDEFKPLFKDWVKSFDKSNIDDDGWGLWV